MVEGCSKKKFCKTIPDHSGRDSFLNQQPTVNITVPTLLGHRAGSPLPWNITTSVSRINMWQHKVYREWGSSWRLIIIGRTSGAKVNVDKCLRGCFLDLPLGPTIFTVSLKCWLQRRPEESSDQPVNQGPRKKK